MLPSILSLFVGKRRKRAEVTIGRKRFSAILSVSTAEKALGLGGAKKLGNDECMLFVSKTESRIGIWGLNMNFPIDVIWVGENMSVVDIKKDLEPCICIFCCKVYKPRKEAKYVIEVNKGIVSRFNIRIRTRIRLKIPNMR
jgi:uncharacterized membrane protein (UPF0127 family)